MFQYLIPLVGSMMPLFPYFLFFCLALEFVSFTIAFIKRRIFDV